MQHPDQDIFQENAWYPWWYPGSSLQPGIPDVSLTSSCSYPAQGTTKRYPGQGTSAHQQYPGHNLARIHLLCILAYPGNTLDQENTRETSCFPDVSWPRMDQGTTGVSAVSVLAERRPDWRFSRSMYPDGISLFYFVTGKSWSGMLGPSATAKKRRNW